MTDEEHRLEVKRGFVAGYLHGRSSLGDYEAAGKEADAAFERWWHWRHISSKDTQP